MEDLKQQHETAKIELSPSTLTLIAALKDSGEVLAPALIYLLENQDRNSQRLSTIESNVLYHSQVLEFFDKDIQGTKQAQQEWGFLKPMERFRAIRDAFFRHRLAITIIGVVAAVGLALHFVKV